MNRAILMGRLTKDPEVRYTQAAEPMCIARYTLAVDRRGRRSNNAGEQTADFIPCVAFSKGGEFAEKNFQKGMRVLVSGRIQTGSYTNREGQKVYTTEVIVDDQEFADSKQAGGTAGARQADVQSAKTGSYQQESFMQIPDGVDDEGLPFN